MNKKEVLAIIPARGGSKRIPRKNIVSLCGKPLIAYSIEAALRTKEITRVIVSTDDREIADVSISYGAEVPFFRPEKIAKDFSVLGDAINYTLNTLSDSGYRPDIVCELYPTNVFRTPSQLSFLISKLFAGYNYVKTVKPIKVNLNKYFVINEDGRCEPLSQNNFINGMDVFFRTYGLFSGRNLHKTKAHGIYIHTVTNPINLIDIDNSIDLYIAENIIKKKLFDFELK